MILLDTNALLGMKTLDGAAIHLLQGLARITKHELAVPAIVAEEFLSNRTRQRQKLAADFERAATDFRAALPHQWQCRDLHDLVRSVRDAWIENFTTVPPELITDAQATELMQLRQVFKVLPAPTGAAEEALRREAWRIPPAQSADNAKGYGVGGRDVLVWLTVLDLLDDPAAEVVLVANDGRAFGRGDLPAALRSEVDAKPGRFSLFRTLTGLLDHLGQSTEPPHSLRELVTHSLVFERAVTDYLDTVEHDASVTINAVSKSSYLVAPQAPRTVVCQDVVSRQARLVGNEVWTVATVDVRAEHQGPLMSEGAESTDEPGTFRCSYAIELTCVIGVQNDEVIGMEVLSARPWRQVQGASVDGMPLTVRRMSRGGYFFMRDLTARPRDIAARNRFRRARPVIVPPQAT